MSQISVDEKRYAELLEKEKKLDAVVSIYPEIESGQKLTPAAKRYRSALESLAAQVEKVMTCEELASIFQIAYIHGFKYKGPGFGDELAKVNKLLGKI